MFFLPIHDSLVVLRGIMYHMNIIHLNLVIPRLLEHLECVL